MGEGEESHQLNAASISFGRCFVRPTFQLLFCVAYICMSMYICMYFLFIACAWQQIRHAFPWPLSASATQRVYLWGIWTASKSHARYTYRHTYISCIVAIVEIRLILSLIFVSVQCKSNNCWTAIRVRVQPNDKSSTSMSTKQFKQLSGSSLWWDIRWDVIWHFPLPHLLYFSFSVRSISIRN